MFKVNEYFEGNVKSISFNTKEGPATTGVMAKGDYEFGTSSIEIMIVTTGRLSVQLPGQLKAKTYKQGNSFKVAANVKFKVKAEEESSYVCLYK